MGIGLKRRFAVMLALAALAEPSIAQPPPSAANTNTLPYQIERFAVAGPMAGVIAKIDVSDARVATKVVLADDRDPDGEGPCVGQLDTPSVAARKHDFVITLNASFFGAPIAKDIMGKRVRYFVGNANARYSPE